MVPATSVASGLHERLPAGFASAIAAIILAALVIFVVRTKRPPARSIAPVVLVLTNPFMVLAMFAPTDPMLTLTIAAALVVFDGALALAAHRNDKGTVQFATSAAISIALIGIAPALHAPFIVFSALLSPWRQSASQVLGFLATAWLPSIMVVIAAFYLNWLFSGLTPIAIPSFDLSLSHPPTLLALAAAPSILLGVIAPGSGGSRRGAIFATFSIASLCLLTPASTGAFVALGAVAFAAEAARVARLGRGATPSLLLVWLISAGLLWLNFGMPASIHAFRQALEAAEIAPFPLH